MFIPPGVANYPIIEVSDTIEIATIEVMLGATLTVEGTLIVEIAPSSLNSNGLKVIGSGRVVTYK